jgi:hypothetical protein
MPDFNPLAMLVAAIAAMIIGFIWYGPLFNKLWMEGMGWDPNDKAHTEKMKKSATSAYIQMFIGVILQVWVLTHVLWAFSLALPETKGIMAGVQGGFWVWLGFVLPIKYGDKIWGGKKFKYVAIDLGYYLVNLIVMSVILSVWK